MTEHPEQVEYAGGKAASSKGPALHYIPTVALEKTAARFALGVARKGDKSWNAISGNQEILTNREFLIERCSHIIHHALKLRDKLHAGDIAELEADDDASAVVWGGMFLQCAVDALVKQAGTVDKAAAEVAWPNVSAEEPKQSPNTHPACGACGGSGWDPIADHENIECRECSGSGAEGHWEAVPVYDETKELKRITHPYGYKVRWSVPGPGGEYLWVGYYFAGEGPNPDPNIGWCQHAAESHAGRWNDEKKCPWEFAQWKT